MYIPFKTKCLAPGLPSLNIAFPVPEKALVFKLHRRHFSREIHVKSDDIATCTPRDIWGVSALRIATFSILQPPKRIFVRV